MITDQSSVIIMPRTAIKVT